MIIRNKKDSFVFIKQHDHAHVSGILFSYLAEHLMVPSQWKKDIEFAIYQHDCGWIPFDANPFWDDEREVPYSFSSFPKEVKTVLYKHGINAVEKNSAYAALLCSKHYSSFMDPQSSELVNVFVQKEKTRQIRLRKAIQSYDEELFRQHSTLLTFFDDLSLYFCLHDPGVKKVDEHYFFKNGIRTPSFFGTDSLSFKWLSNEQFAISDAIFTCDFTFELKQKVVRKADIKQMGLHKAYTSATEEEVPIRLIKSI